MILRSTDRKSISLKSRTEQPISLIRANHDVATERYQIEADAIIDFQGWR